MSRDRPPFRADDAIRVIVRMQEEVIETAQEV
jgi:hypothetical protein